jgi:cysteinyl-tRNA synthetase
LGNFFLIRDVLKNFDPEVLRFFMLRAHYRSPINYSDAQLEEARSGLVRLYTALSHAPAGNKPLDPYSPWAKRFSDAMNDDFNTPEAIAALFDLTSEVNRAQGEEKVQLATTLKSLAATLNFLQRDPTVFLQAGSPGGEAGLSTIAIEEQIAARVVAKQAKDFAKADFIRKSLLEQGVVLEDKPGGLTEWRRS